MSYCPPGSRSASKIPLTVWTPSVVGLAPQWAAVRVTAETRCRHDFALFGKNYEKLHPKLDVGACDILYGEVHLG